MKPNVRNDADAELPHAHLLQILHLILFSTLWLLDSFIFSFSTFLASLIPLAIRLVLTISVLALGFSITSLGHWLLFNKKLLGLVTTGILAHVRHPMHLGYILAYLGCIVGTMSFKHHTMVAHNPSLR
jgi:protein-S-isoprenylcysteine O-methyltransferase Ste14